METAKINVKRIPNINEIVLTQSLLDNQYYRNYAYFVMAIENRYYDTKIVNLNNPELAEIIPSAWLLSLPPQQGDGYRRIAKRYWTAIDELSRQCGLSKALGRATANQVFNGGSPIGMISTVEPFVTVRKDYFDYLFFSSAFANSILKEQRYQDWYDPCLVPTRGENLLSAGIRVYNYFRFLCARFHPFCRAYKQILADLKMAPATYSFWLEILIRLHIVKCVKRGYHNSSSGFGVPSIYTVNRAYFAADFLASQRATPHLTDFEEVPLLSKKVLDSSGVTCYNISIKDKEGEK